ncbi:MAG: succinylglutamate desuccinylase/aspartoacylase family protein [Bacteroidota bacterium]
MSNPRPHIDENNQLHLLGELIPPGKSIRINLNTAKLHTHTSVEVPVIVERAKRKGPVILITAGIHGDEINGVEVVRQIIARGINKPQCGTIICIPVLNIFGFINSTREFPDGRDLNRMFPGSKNGALASRFAYQVSTEILPVADLCLDFHTGGASRFNAPQIRISKGSKTDLKWAKIFNAPFTVFSQTIKKSYRKTCENYNIPILLFEGGKSNDSNKEIAKEGVNGIMRILAHRKMLKSEFKLIPAEHETIFIENTGWLRAKYSGLLHVKIPIGKHISKGEILAIITDPYGSFRHKVKASNDGYIINANQAPIVYQGDAIFHISKDA